MTASRQDRAEFARYVRGEHLDSFHRMAQSIKREKFNQV